jgi:phosphatidylethanolamine/phosphatidyl-N-methylethanolamine N-methyltransferase
LTGNSLICPSGKIALVQFKQIRFYAQAWGCGTVVRTLSPDCRTALLFAICKLASDSRRTGGWRMNTSDLDQNIVETAYARWAPIYDAVCGPVMVKGRRAAAAKARASGGRILEVGVGTGLSFDDYDASTEITGIDLSVPMLAKARAKMASGRYPWVRDVQLMDAHQLSFADATFDCVVAQFVITLVADPERVLSECYRVVKPGGRIILVNHLYSETGVAAAVERWAAQRTRAIGLRPEFPFARLQAWAEANHDAVLVERRKVAPFGIYTLVCFERAVPSAAA